MDEKFLKQTSQKEQINKDNPFLAYFYNLTYIPEPKKLKHDDIKYIYWQSKLALGRSVILLEVVYMNIMSYLTAYYPFSKLHTYKLFHANHKKLRKLIHDIEEITRKANMPIFATGGDNAGPTYIITANPVRKMKASQLKDLQELLEKKFKQAYVSEDREGIKIVVSQDLVF